MRRFFREVYMDSVFPLLNSAELPPYIWGSDEREKVKTWLNLSQDIFLGTIKINRTPVT